MKRARFTEEQIIGVLKEHEAGAKTADLARKHGVSEATLYNWKAKYGGMDVSEAKRLKELEDENAKLKKLLADSHARCGRASRASVKKMVGPAAKREGVAHLRAAMGLSERRACIIVSADRTMIRYRSRRPPDTELREQICAIWPTSASASAIGGCSSCCGRSGEPSGHQPHLPALSRGRADGAQAARPAARRGGAGADPGRGEGQRPLVAGFRPRPVRLRPAVPHPEHRRRRDAGMPGGDPRHLDLGPARGARTDGADRAARQARHDRLATMAPSSPRTPCSPGRRTTGSTGISSRRESRCRTASARVSTAACATSC